MNRKGIGLVRFVCKLQGNFHAKVTRVCDEFLSNMDKQVDYKGCNVIQLHGGIHPDKFLKV